LWPWSYTAPPKSAPTRAPCVSLRRFHRDARRKCRALRPVHLPRTPPLCRDGRNFWHVPLTSEHRTMLARRPTTRALLAAPSHVPLPPTPASCVWVCREGTSPRV